MDESEAFCIDFNLSVIESLVFDDSLRLSMEMGNNVSFHSKKEGRTSRPSPQGEDLSIGPLVYLFFIVLLFFSFFFDFPRHRLHHPEET